MLSTDLILAESSVDEDTLLDIAAEIGFQLSLYGAETFRIEESVYRILTPMVLMLRSMPFQRTYIYLFALIRAR
jgi:ABC-type methionine transport system permease subunit